MVIARAYGSNEGPAGEVKGELSRKPGKWPTGGGKKPFSLTPSPILQGKGEWSLWRCRFSAPLTRDEVKLLQILSIIVGDRFINFVYLVKYGGLGQAVVKKDDI
jgi:hypothetical protein